MLVFTCGLCANEQEYVGLLTAISNFLKPRLPANTPMTMLRWYEDLAAQIKLKAPPPQKLVMVGFSFGGGKSVEACRQLQQVGRNVDALILIDPVSPTWPDANAKPKDAAGNLLPKPWTGPWQGNTWDFVLPDNVKRAWCFYREAREVPWSAPIRKAKCEFYNKKYNGKNPLDVLAAHGEYVWSGETVDAIKRALAL
jgi:hypothetical protein